MTITANGEKESHLMNNDTTLHVLDLLGENKIWALGGRGRVGDIIPVSALAGFDKRKMRKAIKKGLDATTMQALWRETFEPTPVEKHNEAGISFMRFSGVVRPESRWWSNSPGLEQLTQAILENTDDGSVRKTVLRITSGGGSVSRIEDFTRAVEEHKKEKPIVAHVTDFGYSMAYWMVANFSEIVCDPVCGIGGLGIYKVLLDTSAMWEEMGIAHILVNDNKDGIKGHDRMPENSKELVANVQEEVLYVSSLFRQAVQSGRGFDESTVDDLFTGEAWIGEQARDIGLVDNVSTWWEFSENVTNSATTVMLNTSIPDLPVQTNGTGNTDNTDSGATKVSASTGSTGETLMANWFRRTAAKDNKGREETEATNNVENTNDETQSAGEGGSGASNEIGIDGMQYLLRAVGSELSAAVSADTGQFPPGIAKDETLQGNMRFLYALGVMADGDKQDKTAQAACPSLYDLGDAVGWNTSSMMAHMIELCQPSSPYTSIMGAMKQATHLPGLKNLAHDQVQTGAGTGTEGDGDSTPVPTGGGILQGTGNDTEHPFSSMNPAQQALTKRVSGGRVHDDETYKQAMDGRLRVS